MGDTEHRVRQRTVIEDGDGHVRVVEKRRKRRKWSPGGHRNGPDGRDPALTTALWILGAIAVAAGASTAASWYTGLHREFEASAGTQNVVIQFMADNSIKAGQTTLKPGDPNYDAIAELAEANGIKAGAPPKTVTAPVQGPPGNAIDLREKLGVPVPEQPHKQPSPPKPKPEPYRHPDPEGMESLVAE